MKQFLTFIVGILLFIIGYTCIYFYIKSSEFNIFFFIGGHLLTVPCLLFYWEKLEYLFKK
jgi:hypothetical protein